MAFKINSFLIGTFDISSTLNVPIIMQWMFGAMKLFVAKGTIAKMQWMSYGSELHKDLGPNVPKAYGGSGPELAHAGIHHGVPCVALPPGL